MQAKPAQVPVRIALQNAKLPYHPCGLNADWSTRAWHLGPGSSPNRVDGDLYLLEDEDDESRFTLVRRWYATEDSLDGNDSILEIDEGTLALVLPQAVRIIARTAQKRALAEWEASG